MVIATLGLRRSASTLGASAGVPITSLPAWFKDFPDPSSFMVPLAHSSSISFPFTPHFALVGLMDRFVYLSYGLAVLLGFVGVKMLLTDVWKMPTWLSLAVIVGVLAVTALLSLRADREREREAAAA